MRESYQILFFILSVYWGLQFRLKPAKNALIFFVLSALIMGFFHIALILYILFLIPLVLLWFPKQIYNFIKSKWYFSKKKILIISIILFLTIGTLIIGMLTNITGLDALKSFFLGKGLEYAIKHRTILLFQIAPDARANYGIMLDKSSLGALLKTTSLAYVYYLFAPFPWQITNWLDVYAFTESLLRFILILYSLISWYQAKGLQRSIWGLLLIIYFSMTLLWSTGTVNYGTSIRHHLLTNWIIVLLGGPGLIKFIVKQVESRFLSHENI